MVEIESHYRIETLYIWLLVNGKGGEAITDVIQGGWHEVPTGGDDLAFEAEVADNYAVGLGVGINTNDRLRIGVSDEVGLEHAGTDGEVSSGLEDCVVDVSLIQDVEYTSEALLQGGVSQVFDADGDLAAGADEADEVAGQGLACGEVALA